MQVGTANLYIIIIHLYKEFHISHHVNLYKNNTQRSTVYIIIIISDERFIESIVKPTNLSVILNID